MIIMKTNMKILVRHLISEQRVWHNVCIIDYTGKIAQTQTAITDVIEVGTEMLLPFIVERSFRIVSLKTF